MPTILSQIFVGRSCQCSLVLVSGKGDDVGNAQLKKLALDSAPELEEEICRRDPSHW